MKFGRASQNLPEIECIEALERIEEQYALQFGHPPFSLSHWDATETFENKMLRHLKLPVSAAFTSYRFSYQISNPDAVAAKLGGNSGVHRALFTPSATTSILSVLNWLKCQPPKKVIALCPAYFSLFHACRRFRIPIRRMHVKRINGAVSLPSPEARIWNEPSVLWLTSPMYGAGLYFSKSEIAFVAGLLRRNWTVVADECLALPGHELIRELGEFSNFISIYSPHKSICVNGAKFSAIIFHTEHLDFMDRWADVWSGGLGFSSTVAIEHFLSSNFDSYVNQFLSAIRNQEEAVASVCASRDVQVDSEAKGHFISCYFPELSARLGVSDSFLNRLVFITGGSLISGNRNRYDPRWGFSFRVNLARGGPHFIPTLSRVVEFLSSA